MKLAFLASNNGSSMRAIVAAIRTGELDAEARLIVSNKKDAPALSFARENGISALHIPTMKDEAGADSALSEALARAGATHVVLSGYLRKLGPKTLSAFQGRILNVHPALLPKFGGQGFYGRRVHEAVVAAREAMTGVTIHLVDGEYDHGPVVAQFTIPVSANDSAEDVERKVVAAEPGFFVDTLKRLVSGEIVLQIP
ncbi:MAG: phosphoribosylglycinamide formyltransferase [Caulobacterales bacterium]